jgi:alpha-L-arabinofuranosidase
MQTNLFLHQGVIRTLIRRPSRLALTFAALITSAVTICAQPTPVGYLPCDEGTGNVAHDVIGHHDATLFGASGWEAGLVGPFALSFPGSPVGFPPGSYAEIPSGDVLDTTQSYTVAAWVKLKDLNGYQTFVSEDGNFESAFFLQLRGDSHQFSFTVPYGFFILCQSGFTPVVNQWYHLAGVYDAIAQSVSLYVNGVVANTVYNVPPVPANGLTGIGRGWFNNTRVDFNHAAVDDVRFYNSALSAADVFKVALIGNPSLTPPTVQLATLEIDAAHPGAAVNPMFSGLMIEEINHSLDGGLYGELIQNRVFQDATTPVHWSLVQDNGGVGSIVLDTTQPVAGTDLANSLKVTVTQGQRVGAANDGYWGIPVKPFTTYRASFWAKADVGFTGPLTLDIESSDGSVVYARAQVPQITTSWAKYTVPIRTFDISPTENTRYVVSTSTPGAFWLTQVSLFRPTFNDRPNGNRIGLMAKMAAMKPGFLRMPGGNYLEGITIDTRFNWKNTLGPIEQRPGHQGTWGYRSDDGLGLLEFLEWCEDLHMQPLLAVYAGYSLNGTHVNPGPDLVPYVQDALDEIQYLTGSTSTTWGARRAADGHPAPFSLSYVEIGNEDFFDRSGSYDGRFAQFYDAIKAAYPNLKLIATARVTNPSRPRDLIDDHFYDTPLNMAHTSNRYDPSNYDRTTQPKVFVGEWASISGHPTPDLAAALGDAAWLTGLERNADVVSMEAYAPLLVNINPGANQWPTNLIGYDALNSYGSPSYYLQVMFDWLHGDVVLPTTLTTPGTGSMLYESVTRDSQDGTVYLKLVNMADQVQPLHVDLNGAQGIAKRGRAVVLKGSPQDTNSLSNPYRVVPTTAGVDDLGNSFDYSLPPYSITVLRLSVGDDRKGHDYDEGAGHQSQNQD